MDGNKQTNKQTIPCPVESKVNIKGTHHPKTQKNCIDRMIDNPFWKVFFKKQNLGIIYPVCTFYCIRCKHTNDRNNSWILLQPGARRRPQSSKNARKMQNIRFGRPWINHG